MTDELQTEAGFQAPYMSWATFDSIVEQFRTVGLPAQIDRSVLRSRSGGDQSQFLRAASSFGFIDGNGAPTPRFRRYVEDPEVRPEIMGEVIGECYPNVVSLPADATPQMLAEQIRALKVEGDTARKATAFYLNAARFAQLTLSPHFKTTRPGAGGRKAGSRRTTTNRNKTENAENPPPPAPDPMTGLHPAVVTLVQAVPGFDGNTAKPEFSEAEREAWFAYAKATFNLIYTTRTDDQL